MADGTTIQRASFAALADGVTLPWILAELESIEPAACRAHFVDELFESVAASSGWIKLPRAAAAAGVAGFIVPDLPFEESGDLKRALEREGLALVQMVTPVTPPERLADAVPRGQGIRVCGHHDGHHGQGAVGGVPDEVLEYMDRVKRCSSVPVCAGFGIRSREQVARFARHVDGVVVGSALVEVLERGEDVGAFLRSLRGGP